MLIAVYRMMVYVVAGAECSLWNTTGDNQRAFNGREEEENKLVWGWSLTHFLRI